MKKLYFVLVLLFLLGCSGDNTASNAKDGEETTDEPKTVNIDEDIISDILQSIPSPLEISNLIKEVSNDYNVSNLNNYNYVDNYNTSFKQALNLGVYSTDLGYCNLYNKNQDVLNYLNSVKKLADQLSIGQYFDYATIKRLAQNSNNLDSLLNMTQRNFEAINSHLREQKRENLSILILTGGWVEAVYLTTLVYQQTNNQRLKEKIGEQKIALDQILLVLDIYKTKPNFNGLIADLKELQKIYNRVEIKTIVKPPIIRDVGGEITIVDQNESQVNIKDADLESISSLLKSIRNKVIK
jgi:hypothetical protein